MLSAHNLSLRLGEHLAVDDVSLDLEPGTVTAILGPNGAGKTSLLNLLTGTLPPASGGITLDGQPLSAYDSHELACRRAVLAQTSHLSFNFSVRDIVEMGRLPHLENTGQQQSPDDEAIIQAAIEQADITHLAQRTYLTLSGGERQRVHLARVLAQIWPDPTLTGTRCLFLDEPTNNLDLAHQHACLDQARHMARQGLAVCCVLHDLNLALTHTDHAAVMRRSRLHALGPTSEVLSADLVRDVFQVEATVVDHPKGRFILTTPR